MKLSRICAITVASMECASEDLIAKQLPHDVLPHRMAFYPKKLYLAARFLPYDFLLNQSSFWKNFLLPCLRGKM